MYLKTINEKGENEIETEQGGGYEGVWSEGREGEMK